MTSEWTLFAALLIVYALWRVSKHRSLSHIRGPPSQFLYGNTFEMTRQEEVGDLDFRWMREYGGAWRINGCLGEEMLMIADPKALLHVFQKGGYDYPKNKDARQFIRLITGPGLIWSTGKVHQRQRKLINPAFTPARLRSYLSTFQRNAAKMTQGWKTELSDAPKHESVITVNSWLSRVTLDIIGETAFSYSFGAMDNVSNPVSDAYKNLFANSLLWPSKLDLIFKSLWKYIPERILTLVEYLPTREYAHFRRTLKVINGVARELIQQKREALGEGKIDDENADIMTILIKANASEDPNTRLSDDELIAQMSTFILAGHETTSSSMNWLFWELAKHPEYQKKIREEISAVRSRVSARGDTEFKMEDYDSMTYTLAAMKEAMRLHPTVYHLSRTSVRDDVIPLSKPITTTTGASIDSIPISAGTTLLFSLCGYNRMPEVWGEDADSWNPERFINTDAERQISVGLYANLMTFSAGVRGCVGWRFSVLEMQAILVDLLEHVEFSLPDDEPQIQRVPTGQVMTPMIRGKMMLGPQMPLKVSLL